MQTVSTLNSSWVVPDLHVLLQRDFPAVKMLITVKDISKTRILDPGKEDPFKLIRHRFGMCNGVRVGGGCKFYRHNLTLLALLCKILLTNAEFC